MLVQLTINNFILIQNITVDLSNRFNAFTGETGAGKSLFVDALNFVSGGRSSASVVGKVSDTALVEAVFELNDSDPSYITLKEMNLISDDDSLIVVSREMNQNGRSVSRINNRIVNLSTIRDITGRILDIHSQHETQYLLNEKNHLNLLDEYMNNETIVNDYKLKYAEYERKVKEINEFKKTQFNEEELEFSKFVLADINKINPSIDDYTELKERLDILVNFEKNKALYDEVDGILSKRDNVVGKLYDLMHAFKEFPELEGSYKDAYYQLEDIALQVSHLNSNLLFDESEFNQLNQRMVQYNQFIRKYGSIEGLMNKKLELETKINQVDHFEDLLVDLENDRKVLYNELAEVGISLSNSRKQAAKRLETSILIELKDLMLENTRFSVNFEACEYTQSGNEAVTFFISLNKGMPLAPLSKVASGGELSRVMLGLKVIFSKIQGISTLIFDEIDSGVSGRVAFRIGEKMKEISKDAQVISITHLPTVAACSDHHYLIDKHDNKNDTVTSVRLLDRSERIEHLAVMMAGKLDNDALKTAENLLNEGQSI